MGTLDRLKGKTKLQDKLITTLREQGWTVTVMPFPGAVTFGHPSNDKDIPTPDYAREEYAPGRAHYPFPNYHVLHQVTLMYEITSGNPAGDGEIEIKIGTVFKRESSAPWVSSHEHSVGFQAAIDYVKSPHPADDPSVPVATREEFGS